MNTVICEYLYLLIVRCTPIVLHPFLKGVCDTPLVLLMLKFCDLHPFLILHLHSVYMHTPFLTVKVFSRASQILSENKRDLDHRVAIDPKIRQILSLRHCFTKISTAEAFSSRKQKVIIKS